MERMLKGPLRVLLFASMLLLPGCMSDALAPEPPDWPQVPHPPGDPTDPPEGGRRRQPPISGATVERTLVIPRRS